MSDAAAIDRATVAQTTANIGLAGDLFQELLANPDALDEIPDDATLVLLPSDDPARALRNLALAGRLASRGQTAYLRRVGEPAWGRLPRWAPLAARASGWSITYDSAVDELTVLFTDDPDPAERFPVGAGFAVLVDPDTLEVRGYVVPESLAADLADAARNAVALETGYRLGPGEAEAYAAFVEDLAPLAA